jgi:crotonobetainyl-CoA:carnitine CoA-transferase CaiB-like acyl-CoA transferase
MATAKIDLPTMDRAELVDALAKLGISSAAVRTIGEVGTAETLQGGLIRLVQDGRRRWPLLELPFGMSRMSTYELRPVSSLGAANAKFVRAAS